MPRPKHVMTERRKRFIKELKTSATPTEAARKAGYRRPKDQAHDLMHDEFIKKKIEEYGEVGLDTLKTVAKEGKVEIARVAASKVLVETAYGRPDKESTHKIGNVTINVHKLEDVKPLLKATANSSPQ